MKALAAFDKESDRFMLTRGRIKTRLFMESRDCSHMHDYNMKTEGVKPDLIEVRED